ncbi:MAG TPA: sporulation histidine kinase inhibitor Sda [Bacillota bacterium]|nr:sporulation histidine kinase inhibitor Sda [Bacillota bacterium]
MKSLSREQLIETYLVAQKEGLADAFIQMIKQEMETRQVTHEEIANYNMNQKKYFMN